jgi:MFS family permease
MVQGDGSQSSVALRVDDALPSVIGEIRYSIVVRLVRATAIFLRLGDRRHRDDCRRAGCGCEQHHHAVVLKPISEDLGWSRTLMAAAITIGSLTGGLLSPLFGPLADRLGPRVLLPLGGALVGSLAFGVSASTEPWQFYATFIPARALTEFLLCGMIAFTAVANWFHVMRPRAMGLVAMATPLGSAGLSLVYQFFVTHYGWRSTFLALGIALWLLVVIPGLIFLRRQPEDLGLFPDGRAPSDPRSMHRSTIRPSLARRRVGSAPTRCARVRFGCWW